MNLAEPCLVLDVSDVSEGGFGVLLTTGGNELVKNRVRKCGILPFRDDHPGENVFDRNKTDVEQP